MIISFIFAGFFLIGRGIKTWINRIRRNKDELVQDIQGGEFGLFGDTRYHIKCADCKGRNSIIAPENPVDQECMHCGAAILTRRKENRTIQEGWPSQILFCPKCKEKILLRNSIVPLRIECSNCSAKLNIKDEDDPKREVQEGFIECPKCGQELDMSLRLGDWMRCPNCGVKMKFND